MGCSSQIFGDTGAQGHEDSATERRRIIMRREDGFCVATVHLVSVTGKGMAWEDGRSAYAKYKMNPHDRPHICTVVEVVELYCRLA